MVQFVESKANVVGVTGISDGDSPGVWAESRGNGPSLYAKCIAVWICQFMGSDPELLVRVNGKEARSGSAS